MNRMILFSLLFAVLGCSQNPALVRAEGIQWYTDLNQAQQVAESEEKPLLIDFYTDWCGWCKRLDKDTYSNDKVIELAKQFICVKVNAEKQPLLAKQYNIRGFPSTVFLKSDGSIISTYPGYMPPDQFLQLMNSILAEIGK